jgi:hypothetical protein
MRKIPWVFVAFAMIASLLGLTTPAAADGNVVYKVAQVTVSASDVSVKASNVKKIKTALEVRWVMPKGLPRNQQDNCVTVRQAGKVYQIGDESFKVGQKYYTDYRDRSGNQVWHWKTVVKGDKFCLVNGKVIREQCGNEATRTRPPVVAPKVVVVKQFTSLKMQVKVSATAKGTGVANVLCTANDQSASASVSLSLYGNVHNKIVVRAKTKARAKVKAQNRLEMSLRQQVTANVKDKAQAEVLGKGVASCALNLGVTPPECPPGSIFDPFTGTCAKDGSTTPLPPTDAPGPNPTPVPGPGGGGPSECYDPVTGLPVPPGTPGAWCAA